MTLPWCAAAPPHPHHAGEALRETRIQQHGKRQIRQRPEPDVGEFTWILVCQPDRQLGGGDIDEVAEFWIGKVGVSEPVVTVDLRIEGRCLPCDCSLRPPC